MQHKTFLNKIKKSEQKKENKNIKQLIKQIIIFVCRDNFLFKIKNNKQLKKKYKFQIAFFEKIIKTLIKYSFMFL
jgi:hypothetical protein